ncbi:DUF5672 family protein [Spirosoma rhododendri]|uniref:DUF5672 domain-containing protein n=1 Tax=Spirosoma rhododendri TaxID=2728024 RepID=A0A7L5DR71_9BACT|nr:DUF5672 family protein [Spirosoma rhododendri]QJD79048.1 hypothetical protein HH216_11900 [Spirosoma rhododendri]
MSSSLTTSVCVVIPVYKPVLSAYEQISLTQCMKVLGHYPVCLVAPRSLDLSAYTNQYPTLRVYRFDDSFFANIQAYNQLMLNAEFYRAFIDWEYMLLYQLDAFVFRDELADWCRRGYDYVGAPWLRDIDFVGWRDAALFRARQRMATLLDLKKDDGVTPREIISQNMVGNGGFSLRRIPAMLAVLKSGHKHLHRYQNQTIHQYNEDAFWGIEVNRYWPRLRIPSYRTALHFSVEFFPQRAIERYMQGKLPFGCHAWDIHGTEYWRPVFARYGYQI